MKTKSQVKDVLNYLKECGSISPFEAWEKFHITRLASIICVLRKRGEQIKTIPVDGINDYGHYQYALYTLIPEEE